jgi:hypothetical protein
MAESTSQELDLLDGRYRARFAGQPRVTRDADELEEMLARLNALPVDAELADRAKSLREQWTEELVAIRAMQAVPYALPAARLRGWADLTMSRYARCFAGQDRRTRDLGLLIEIHADLQGIRRSMADLSQSAPAQQLESSIVAVDRQLATYANEIEAIRGARRTGQPHEQGTRYAQLANEQFELYEFHFAGKPRASRHLPVLDRILGSLEEIRRGMQSLAVSGYNDANNTRNQGVVDQRLQSFGAERKEIEKVKAATPVAERATALGAAANDVFAAYRNDFAGKSRTSVDEQRLNRLFELLWPIARQMDEIDAEHDIDNNTSNLRIVVDNLTMYGREFDAIRAAKASA